MAVRIGLIGAAGTGKSTLATAVSKEFGLRFLAAKKVTQSILDSDGYDYGAGVHIERFLADSRRQLRIMRNTFAAQSEAVDFVADRTAVDLAAYALVELHDSDVATLGKVFDECRKRVGLYTHLFLCPWLGGPMKDNRRRTLNPWYQRLVHTVEMGVVREWGLASSVHVFEAESCEDRMDEVRTILGGR
jgi:predicted ATPase